MSSLRKELLEIIKATEKVLKNISDDEFNKLLAGKGSLIYVEDELIEEKKEFQVSTSAYASVEKKLKEFDTREKAAEFMEELKLKKDDLLSIGELVNANINKKENKAVMIERIVEATVGARLRSEAIKEIDLKRKY